MLYPAHGLGTLSAGKKKHPPAKCFLQTQQEKEMQLCWFELGSDVVGTEPGAQSSQEERGLSLSWWEDTGLCVLARPSVSPIPTVSPGNVSLAASTSEAVRKEGELPSAGQVPEASLVSTWRLCVPLCPLDAQHLLPWNAHFYCFPHVAWCWDSAQPT